MKMNTVPLKDLKYSSFVGNRLPFVYMATPKAACSTMKRVLYHLEGKKPHESLPGIANVHYRFDDGIGSVEDLASLMRLQQDPTRCFFAVVRNPFSRLASAWEDKIYQLSPNYRHVQKNVSTYLDINPETPADFPGFVQWLYQTQDPMHCDLHWRPQVYVLWSDLIKYHHIMHVENLVFGLSKVLEDLGCSESVDELLSTHTTNESLPRDWRALYDAKTAKFAQDFYSEDFEKYGYDPESWQATDDINMTPNIIVLQKQLLQTRRIAVNIIRLKNKQIYLLQQKIKNN